MFQLSDLPIKEGSRLNLVCPACAIVVINRVRVKVVIEYDCIAIISINALLAIIIIIHYLFT